MDTGKLTGIVMEHEAKLSAHGEELKTLFSQQKDIKALAKSTQELALSVRDLAGRVNDVDGRLEIIEQDKRHKGSIVWQTIVSALLGGALTYIITLALRGF